LSRLIHSERMHPQLTPIHRLDQLDQLLSESQERPILLFKHSYTCGISAEALDEIVEHINHEAADARYAMVTVQTDRELSNLVASRLGVRHQTPQAIVVKSGRVVWSASHFHVNASEIRQALESVAGQPPAAGR
jgi:bacillithiol system protein YtxJ